MNGLRHAHCPGWRRGTIFRILVKSSRSYAQNRIFLDRLGLSRIVGEKFLHISICLGLYQQKMDIDPGTGTETKRLQLQASAPKQKRLQSKAPAPKQKRLQPQAPAEFIILKK